MNADELVAYWSKVRSGNIHPDDRELVDVRTFSLDQIPVPWAGPLKNAKVFVLMLNPVFTKNDKEYELANSDLRKALRSNFSGLLPCFSFQQLFSDYHGHAWARATYGSDIIERYADSICQINLVAYHSATGDPAKKISANLPTSIAVQSFVHKTLIPGALAGDIGLVVARSSRCWGISTTDESENIVVYQGWENRRALLTEKTRGGQLIRHFVLPQYTVVESPSTRTNATKDHPGRDKQTTDASTDGSIDRAIPESIRNRATAAHPTALPENSPFRMASTDLVNWKTGRRVDESDVRPTSKRFAWLKAMQSVESFSAAKRIAVCLDGKRIADIEQRMLDGLSITAT